MKTQCEAPPPSIDLRRQSGLNQVQSFMHEQAHPVDVQSDKRCAESGSANLPGDIEVRLARILAEGFGRESVHPDDNFFDLGGDSILAAGFLSQVAEEFGAALSLDVLLERPTVRLLADLLRNPSGIKETPALVVIQAGQSGPPLFCLPGIGGNVLEFRLLADQLGPIPPVYAVPAAGLDDHTTPHESIAEMAAYVIRQIRLLQPTGPYHLVGYSLGGVVAFEVALQLQALGETTGLLAIVDAKLWRTPVSLSIGQRLRLHWRNLLYGTNGTRWQYVCTRWRVMKERLRRKDVRFVEEDLVAGLDLTPASRKVARVHWRAWRNYEPRPYDGTITLFVAREDPHLSGSEDPLDETLGWSYWTTKKVNVHRTGLLHLDILRAKELKVLTSELCGGM